MAASPLALAVALLAAAQHVRAQVVQPSSPRPATVAAIALSIRSRAIQDSRCYLMNGGAVESFFISEDTPVGAVIGTLSVNGDPSEAGDITLRLQEQKAAVGVAAGTKNLTLLRPLDREEARGPSNVYVNVRCDRRRTTDPSFIIPVSVRVWDINDNAPVWQGAPYSVRVSELTAPGARVLSVRATDADQPGPHASVHYSVLPGPHSEYLEFANELDGVVVVKTPLDFETLRNFSVVLRAQDQGSPPLHNDTTLTVLVLDADDQNPKFSHEHYTAVLPDDAVPGTYLETSPGPISAVDQDTGIAAPLQFSARGDARGLVAVHRDSGRVAPTERLLAAAQPVTVVLQATQVDNPDRYALATLTISRLPTAASVMPVRFTRRHYTAACPEDTPPTATLLTLHTDNGGQRPLQFYVSDRSFLEKFAINSAGEVLLRRPLDYETTDSYYYQVMVTDGVSNDTATINITVLNVNEWEPRFRYPQYEFHVDAPAPESGSEPAAELLPVGRLDVFDGDKPDTVALTLRGPDASMLQVNELGEVFLRSEALRVLNSSVLHVLATAQDSGSPPRQTSVPVLVHIGGRLLKAGSGGGGTPSRAGVVAVFACALALLALLVCALLAYIYTSKRRSKSSANAIENKSNFVTHEKPRAPAAAPPPAAAAGAGCAGAAGGAGGAAGAGSSGSLLSVSAGASTILANSTSSLDLRAADNHNASAGRQSQRFSNKSKVAPQPPSANASPPAQEAAMSDHLRARGSGRSGVAWPAHTIPARVKKLSWDEPAPPRAQVQPPLQAAGGHERPPARGVAGAHHPRARQEAQLGRARPPARTGQRGGQAAARRHQPHARRPHEPHRLLLDGGNTSDRDDHIGLSGDDTLPIGRQKSPNNDKTSRDQKQSSSNEIRDANQIRSESNMDSNKPRQYALPTTYHHPLEDIPTTSQPHSSHSSYSHPDQQLNAGSENMYVGTTRYNLSPASSNRPLSPSSSSSRIMPSSSKYLHPRREPIELIPIPVIPISKRHLIPGKKLFKLKTRKVSPKHITSVPSPEPIGYIPIQMNHPPLNPDYMPKCLRSKSPPPVKTKPNKKQTAPPKQAQLPAEYISLKVINRPQSATGHLQAVVSPHNQKNNHLQAGVSLLTIVPTNASASTSREGSRTPSGLVTVPSAPQLSISSSMEPSGSFASIDPRKLRTQRVSPLIFTRSHNKYKLF